MQGLRTQLVPGFISLRHRSQGCPLLVRSLLRSLQTEESQLLLLLLLQEDFNKAPHFWFFLFPTTAVSLCVPYSDPTWCDIKNRSGGQLWLCRQWAVQGTREKWFSLESPAIQQWKHNSCQDPKPNQPLFFTPAYFLNQALWLLGIIRLPEEPQLLPQLLSSSRTEQERWAGSDLGAGLQPVMCHSREERAVFKAPLICYGNKTQQRW